MDDEDAWTNIELAVHAARNGKLEMLRAAIAADPTVLQQVDECLSYTPLHWAVDHGQIDAAVFLLDAGSDVNAHCEEVVGYTPLDLAVSSDRLEIAVILLERGANPNIPTWAWITAMGSAIQMYCNTWTPGETDRALEWIGLLTPYAEKFPPPVYPDGTVPKWWPPRIDALWPPRVQPGEEGDPDD